MNNLYGPPLTCLHLQTCRGESNQISIRGNGLLVLINCSKVSRPNHSSSTPIAELWFENSVLKPTGLATAIVNLCKFLLGPSWDRHLQGIAVRLEKKCREKRHKPARPLRKASTMWLSPPTSNTLEV